MEIVYMIFWLAIIAGQIMAIIVCCRDQSPRWLKVCWAIGAVLTIISLLWNV